MVYEVDSGERWGATEKWDRSPSSVEWSPCGTKLFLTAEVGLPCFFDARRVGDRTDLLASLAQDGGFVKLFLLPVPIPSSTTSTQSLSSSSPEPEALTHHGSVASFHPLSATSLLLTHNSLTGPNSLSILDITPRPEDKGKGQGPHGVKLTPWASLTSGLKEEQGLQEGTSFFFAGAEGVQVHGVRLWRLIRSCAQLIPSLCDSAVRPVPSWRRDGRVAQGEEISSRFPRAWRSSVRSLSLKYA